MTTQIATRDEAECINNEHTLEEEEEAHATRKGVRPSLQQR